MINFGGSRVARHLPNRLVTTQGKPGSKTLYLTFDDGPDPQHTLKISELLDSYGAKGSFFCIGQNLKKYPDIASILRKQGHLVANHSENHRQFGKLPLASQLEEVDQCQLRIYPGAEKGPKIFRAPCGQLSFRLLCSLKSRDWHIVHWSYDSEDFRKLSIEEHLARFKKQPVQDGDILLFHDDGPLARDLLQTLLPDWRQDGFKFETVLQLV